MRRPSTRNVIVGHVPDTWEAGPSRRTSSDDDRCGVLAHRYHLCGDGHRAGAWRAGRVRLHAQRHLAIADSADVLQHEPRRATLCRPRAIVTGGVDGDGLPHAFRYCGDGCRPHLIRAGGWRLRRWRGWRRGRVASVAAPAQAAGAPVVLASPEGPDWSVGASVSAWASAPAMVSSVVWVSPVGQAMGRALAPQETAGAGAGDGAGTGVGVGTTGVVGAGAGAGVAWVVVSVQGRVARRRLAVAGRGSEWLPPGPPSRPHRPG